MSFTTQIKDEICTLELSRTEYISELSGYIRNNGEKSYNKISLITENPKVARRIYELIKNIYDINPEIVQGKGNNFNKKNYYNIVIDDKVLFILKDLMYYDENDNYLFEPKEYLVDSEDLSRAYLRGVFLSCGSINDPKTSRYHMEFFIDNKNEAEFVSSLLNNFSINNKILIRDNSYMVYAKEAEKIGDFLRIISANRAVLYYEDIRIYRDHKNMTNRLNNCEQANVDKIIQAAENQIIEINKIIDKIGLDAVDEKLKEVMIYRKKYPDVSLTDLSFIISSETGKQLTKSGLNHRMRKILELAKRISD